MGGKRMRDEAGIAYGGVYLGQRTWMVKLSSAMVCIYLLPVLSGKNTSAYWDFGVSHLLFYANVQGRIDPCVNCLTLVQMDTHGRLVSFLLRHSPVTALTQSRILTSTYEPQRQNQEVSIVIPVLGFI